MSVISAAHDGFLTPAEPLKIDDGCCRGLREIIQTIFDCVTDCLILIWYAIQHALHSLLSFDCWVSDRVFDGRVLCLTSNFGQLTDLPLFVAERRSPLVVDAFAIEAAKAAGFTPTVTSLTPQPYTEGHCFGNVVYILKKWLETQNVHEVLQTFEKGSPHEAVVFQTVYETLYPNVYYPSLTDSLQKILAGTSSLTEERKIWPQSGIAILDSLESYLHEKQNGDPGEMTAYIKHQLAQKNMPISGQYLASVRLAEENHTQINLSSRDRMHAAYAHAGLAIEKTLHLDNSAEAVLKTLSQAEPGAYHLSFPVYSSTGERQNDHATGLIIQNGCCYLLDSNIAIGWDYQSNIVPLIGRLFSEYTGMEYSENGVESPPSGWTQFTNFFKERANPPSEGVEPRFSLCKVQLNLSK